MWGSIIGDIAGSVYEHKDEKARQVLFFEEGAHFSDDSVLTIAVADALLTNKSYAESYRYWGRRYPDAGYGKFFQQWLHSDAEVGQSFGNGAAMRISPVAYWFNTLGEVLAEAERSALITHAHPDAIRGAQAIAASIFMARRGSNKAIIKEYVQSAFDYNLDLSLPELIEHYTFDSTAPGSVPQAIFCFLESTDYRDALTKAIIIGGDTDTLACMAGGIAEAFYGGVPQELLDKAVALLPEEFVAMISEFRRIQTDK